jgi:hypothetical protein
LSSRQRLDDAPRRQMPLFPLAMPSLEMRES